MKPTQPTREQLQEKIKDHLEVNAKLIASRDAAYKIADRLEKQLSRSLHWIEVAIGVVVISLCTFAVGLNIGRKSTKPVVWLSIPSVDSLAYSNMNSAFDNATKTNMVLTPVTNRVISTNQITDTGPAMWITNLIGNFNFYNASNRFTNQPVITNKTHRPIVTRKGAEMLRK